MCKDLDRGLLDFAVLYSPQALPDLHITSVGDVKYRLISSDGAKRASIDPARYIRGAYSAAFDETHRQVMPDCAVAVLASGQSAAVAGLLASMGGAGFVLADTAEQMIAAGGFAAVSDVEPISQPIFAAMHQRHRTSRMHRHLTRIVAREISGRA
jgi:hypothetical protein